MITSRLVGERKAFSAAESGVHAVYTALNFNDLTALKLNDSTTLQWNAKRQVDSTNDSSTRFSAAIPARTGTVPVKGYSEELGYASGSFKIIVTGTDSTYGSSVSIAMGAADLPAPRSTEQGK